MKKSELIKLLNSIPGNPEVKLWNGFVGDWTDIENTAYPLGLVKKTEQEFLERVRIDEAIVKKDWKHQLTQEKVDGLKATYKRVCHWEVNQFVTKEDIAENRYKLKIVYALQAKEKGETSMGGYHQQSIDY